MVGPLSSSWICYHLKMLHMQTSKTLKIFATDWEAPQRPLPTLPEKQTLLEIATRWQERTATGQQKKA